MDLNVMVLVGVAVIGLIFAIIFNEEKKNNTNKNADQNNPIGYDTFVLQSRNEAYTYIEDAQRAIAEYHQNVDTIIGSLNSRSLKSDYVKALDMIQTENEKLKRVLPE